MSKWAQGLLLALLYVTPLTAYEDQEAPTYSDRPLKKNTRPYPEHPMTYNAGPKVKQGYDFFLSGDILYLKPMVNGYVYTATGFLPGSQVPEATGKLTLDEIQPTPGTTYSPTSTYTPGFRVSLGSMVHHGGWDVGAEYFWLYSSDNAEATATDRDPFLLMQSNVEWGQISGYYEDGFFPTKVNFDWNQRYQMVSLILGRNYFANRYLKLRPFVGARGTWQKKRFNLRYGYVDTQALDWSEAPNYKRPPYEFTNTNFIKQWGVGILAGLDSAWQFNDNFSIYGKFSLSQLWFQQRSSLSMDIEYNGLSTTGLANPQNLNRIAPITGANIGSTMNLNQTIQPMIDASLGLRLETYFSDFAYHILFQAGWEAVYWPNQILIIRSGGDTSAFSAHSADFAMHGLTARLRFDF